MKTKAIANLTDIFELEEGHFSTGKLPQLEGANGELYSSALNEWNARKSEGLVLRQNVDPFLKLRALVFRGQHMQAHELISQLKGSKSGAELAEVFLEEAKIACLAGNWILSQSLLNLAFEYGPTTLSRLTLYQIRAHTHFELGDLTSALRDLDFVDSLAGFFPQAPSTLYSSILKIKIKARLQGPEYVRKNAADLWKSKRKNMTPNDLSAFLRLEIDLKRANKEPALLLSLASYIISELMGEKLYSCLSLVDCRSFTNGLRPFFEGELTCRSGEFPRIQDLLKEIGTSETEQSTSAKSIRESLADPIESDKAELILSLFSSCTSIVFLPQNLIFEQSPWTVHSIEGQEQIHEAIRQLFKGPIEKEVFFEKIWNQNRYSPERHDHLIWNLLHRIKKKFRIPISITKNGIVMKDVLVIS